MSLSLGLGIGPSIGGSVVGVPPADPSSLTGTADSGNMVLAWTAGAGATSYEVSRSVAGAGSWSVIAASVSTTSYKDLTANTGGTWDYRVRGQNGGGFSNYITVSSKTVWTVFDSFTGSNGTLVKNRAPDIGPQPTGSAVPTIQGNVAQAASSLAYTPLVYASGVSDFYMRCLCTGQWDPGGGGSQSLPDLCFRRQDDNNYWDAELGNDLIRLYKRAGGSFSEITGTERQKRASSERSVRATRR